MSHLDSPLRRLRKACRARSQLRVNIHSSLASSLLSTVVIGVAYPVYLHYLGLEQYGLWLVLSTVLTMAQLGNLGISPALLKLVAEDYATGDVEGVYRYLAAGLLTLLVSGTVLVSAVLLLRTPIVALFGITGIHAATAYHLLPYVTVLSAYLLMADALNSVLAGLGRYDLVSYLQLSGQVVTAGIAVVLLELHYGVWSLLIANAMGAVLPSLASLVLIRRITGSRCGLRLVLDAGRLRRILNFGSWVFGASIVNTAINPLNKLFISRFAGIGAVPLYDISYAACMKLRSLFESGFRSLAPEFSSLNALRPGDAHRALATADHRGAKAVLLWGTVVYLTAYLTCGPALRLWLGPRLAPELPGVFRIMLVGTYISLWGVQPWYSLLGFGKSRHILLTTIAMAVANIAFVLLWPLVLHRPADLTAVTLGTVAGMLAATLYLRRHGSRLRRDLASFAGLTSVPSPAFTKDLATT